MRGRGFLCLLLAGVLAGGSLVGAAAGVDRPEKEHLLVDYADMEYTGFDDDALQEALGALLELDVSGALDRDTTAIRARVEELYGTILKEYDRIETQYRLIDLLRDTDVTDRWAADQVADFSDRFTYTTDQCLAALSLLAQSSYADIPERDMGEEKVAELVDYVPLTEEEAQFYRREEELIQQYENAVAQEFTVTDEAGKTWTLEEVYTDANLSDGDYYELLTRLEKAENDVAGPIFLELVDIRTRLARIYGYDNYAEYAYREAYNRDYTLEEMADVYKRVQEELVPLYNEVLAVAGEDMRAIWWETPAATGEEILDAVEPYMARIHPQLGATFRFMREHHLYDIEASPIKNAGGYTVGLPAYGSAFIFNSPNGSYEDWFTVIHEFGHFNEIFHTAESGLWADFNIDVGEIHSQGLEVLFIEYGEELFGDLGRGFGWLTLYHLLEAVLDACLQDEFQVRIYENPDMTLEEMNRLYHDLSLLYGYEDRGLGEESYSWVEFHHSFQQPMYYVSYGTSALSAIDLYLLSREDRDRAVELYMELSALGVRYPYKEAVGRVGLRDIFRPGTVEELAYELEAALYEDYRISLGGKRIPRRESGAMPRNVVLILAVSLPVVAGTAVAVAVILVRRKKKTEGGREGGPAAVGGRKGSDKDPWD